MKPLFVGHYCPNDCDRPDLKAKAATKAKIATVDDLNSAAKKFAAAVQSAATPRTWVPWSGIWGPPQAAAIPDDQCRINYCGSKGTKTHVANIVNGAQSYLEIWYQCNLCAHKWCVTKKPTNAAPSTIAPPTDPFVPTWN